ncbi:MAG: hypothetical protein KatS3mg110_0118 [Pirellulaceae bacterium]|nr:MAG: hypothetical protein KatS3mg110_0118 [Pirellulaceae bacterium]
MDGVISSLDVLSIVRYLAINGAHSYGEGEQDLLTAIDAFFTDLGKTNKRLPRSSIDEELALIAAHR